jgi:Transposase DNA-binding
MNFSARARAAGSKGDSTVVAETWANREVSGCEFRDERLAKRFRKLLGRIGSALGRSIPLVCQDWANTKAAYRCLAVVASSSKPRADQDFGCCDR